MSTNGFKPKTTKKIKVNKKTNVTLDTKHNEFVQNFEKVENEEIPSLQDEKKLLIMKLNNEKPGLEEKLNMQDRIQEINLEIRNLRSSKKDYYLKNSKHIFDYFEGKKNISNMEAQSNSSKNNKVDSFFKISQPENTNKTASNNIVKQYLSNIDESFIDVNNFVKTSFYLYDFIS